MRRAAILAALLLSACSFDDLTGRSCRGEPSGGCELVVSSEDECPSFEDVCAGVCGWAEFDCCYCAHGEWESLVTDCAPCDAPPLDAATVDAAPAR